MSWNNTGCSCTLYWRPRLKIFQTNCGRVWYRPEKNRAEYCGTTVLRQVGSRLILNTNYAHGIGSGHQAKVIESELRKRGVKFISANIPDSLLTFQREYLECLYRDMFTLQIEMHRRGSRRATNKRRRQRVRDLKKDILKMRSLGAVYSKANQRALWQSMQEKEKARVVWNRDERRELREKVEDLLNNSFVNAA